MRRNATVAAYTTSYTPSATTSGGDVLGETPPLPQGASTFARVRESGLTGHYWRLPAGTALPEGIGVVADGGDVVPVSPNAPGRHPIYPTRAMSFGEFVALYNGLPREYAGRIR